MAATLCFPSLNADLWVWLWEEGLLQMFVFTQVNSLTDVYTYIQEQAGIKKRDKSFGEKIQMALLLLL